MAAPQLSSGDAAPVLAAPIEVDWAYDEEAVRQECLEAASRSEKTKLHWEVTMQSASSIRKHLAKMEEDKPAVETPVPPWSPTNSAYSASVAGNTKKIIFIADRLAHNRERAAKHQDIVCQQDEQRNAKQLQLTEKLEMVDRRVCERQREIVETQRKRTFNKAQKHSEQQKVMREWQKEHQRVWESYYNAQSKGQGKHGNKDANDAGASSDSVGQPLVRSVGLFEEAFGPTANDEFKSNEASVPTTDENERPERKGGCSVRKSRPAIRRATVAGKTPVEILAQAWELGRTRSQEAAKRFQEELAAKEAKIDRGLIAAAARIELQHRQLLLALSQRSRVWKGKLDNAKVRRVGVEFGNAEKFGVGLTAYTERKAELELTNKDAREAKALELEKKMKLVQEVNNEYRQLRLDRTLKQLARVDEAEVWRTQKRALEKEERKRNDKHEERRTKALAKKEIDMNNLEEKHRCELLSKEKRSDRTLYRLRMTALERERERRLDGLTAQAALAPAGYNSVIDDSEFALPKLSGVMSLPIISRPVVASPISPPAGRAGDCADSESDSEVSDDSGAAGEAEFLSELEGRCSEWLADLRKKKKFAVC